MRNKLTKNKKHFIKNYFNKFSIKYSKNVNFLDIFKNNNKIILEIGFGNGNNLFNSSLSNINLNFIGIEIYLPGIYTLLKNINDNFLNNVKIIKYNAKKIIYKMIKKESIYEIRIFFPDPWKKNKHLKRRLINVIFIKKLLRILEKSGSIHIITDSDEYFEKILEYINFLYFRYNININVIYYKNEYIKTKFEKKALNLNKNIKYLIINKI